MFIVEEALNELMDEACINNIAHTKKNVKLTKKSIAKITNSSESNSEKIKKLKQTKEKLESLRKECDTGDLTILRRIARTYGVAMQGRVIAQILRNVGAVPDNDRMLDLGETIGAGIEIGRAVTGKDIALYRKKLKKSIDKGIADIDRAISELENKDDTVSR